MSAFFNTIHCGMRFLTGMLFPSLHFFFSFSPSMAFISFLYHAICLHLSVPHLSQLPLLSSLSLLFSFLFSSFPYLSSHKGWLKYACNVIHLYTEERIPLRKRVWTLVCHWLDHLWRLDIKGASVFIFSGFRSQICRHHNWKNRHTSSANISFETAKG